MKYLRYAHLIYAVVFALCAMTMLRLGVGIGFHFVLGAVLVTWLVSAVGLLLKKPWAWLGSTTAVALIWLLLVANLIIALRTEPGHSDYVLDIVILLAAFLAPLTAALFGLWASRDHYRKSSRTAGTRTAI